MDAAMRDDLTIVLTLKGREDFTPRWLDYHSRVGLPWPVLIGDGAPSDATAAMFARASALRTTYRRYDDRDLSSFYRKLHDLVAAVDTRYVMLCDNDDFVLPDGVSRSIRFLDDNPDYVSCTGAVLGVYVTDPSFADKDRIFGGERYQLRSIYDTPISNETDAEARVTHLLHNYVPTWYAVHRRDALLKVFADLVERRISDVGLMELFTATKLAALGRQKADASFASYLRQLNSSQGAGSSSGLLADVPLPAVADDVEAMLASVAADIAEGAQDPELVRRLRGALDAYRDSSRAAQAAPGRGFNRFIGRYLHTLRAKVPPVRPVLSWLETRRVVGGLRRHGASEASIHPLTETLDLVWHCASRHASP